MKRYGREMKRLSPVQIQKELDLAGNLLRSGDANSALGKIDQVLRSNLDCDSAYFAKGRLLMTLSRASEALSAFAQAVRYNPRHFEALESAAQLSLGLRLPEQTESFASRLSQLQPENDQAYFLLSVAKSLKGRWLDALESMDRALVIQPTHLNYLVGRAQLLRKLHLNSLSIDCYYKALAISPAHQIGQELAEVLLEESRIEEALDMLQKTAGPGGAESRSNLLIARALTESQRFEEAAPYWDWVNQTSAKSSDYATARAKSEIAGGRLKIAEEILREALNTHRDCAELFGLLAPIAKFTPADSPIIERMESFLIEGTSDPYSNQVLCFALGKSYHDLGDYETAIKFYDRANHLRAEFSPNGLAFNREEWKRDIDLQVNYFDRKRVTDLAQEGLDTSKPLFIVGMIRSGTTLVEQILSGHSRISAGGENAFWSDQRHRLIDLRTGSVDYALARHEARDYLKILTAPRAESDYVIDKNPLNVMMSALLHCVFPNSKFIHILRHPVDNLLSIWMTPMTTGLQFISNKDDLVFAYQQYLRLAAHLENILPSKTFRTVHYEEITGNSASTIEAMTEYLNLEPEQACLHPEMNPRTVRTPSAYQVRQPINTASQARWKLYEPWLGPFSELLCSREDVAPCL